MQTGFVYEVIWLKGSRTPPWQCGLPQRGSVRESSAPGVEKCCSSLLSSPAGRGFWTTGYLKQSEKPSKTVTTQGSRARMTARMSQFYMLMYSRKATLSLHWKCFFCVCSCPLSCSWRSFVPTVFLLEQELCILSFQKICGAFWNVTVGRFSTSLVCFLPFNSFLLPSWGSLLPFQAFWADSLLLLPVLFWVLCFHCHPGLETESAYFPFWFPSLIQECLAFAGRCFFVSIFRFLLISTFSALRAGGQGRHWIWPVYVKLCAIWDFFGGLHTWSSFVHGLQVFEKVQNSIYSCWIKLVN